MGALNASLTIQIVGATDFAIRIDILTELRLIY